MSESEPDFIALSLPLIVRHCNGMKNKNNPQSRSRNLQIAEMKITIRRHFPNLSAIFWAEGGSSAKGRSACG